MDSRRVATQALFWAGATLLALATVLVLLARLAPSEGFQDLARFAGAVLLVALSTPPFGLYLLASRRWHQPAARWRLALATLGCALGLAASFGIASVNFVTLFFLGLPALLLAGGGLVASVPLWRRASA